MAELTDQERAWSDGELIQRFLEHPKLAEAHTVLLYYGVGQEVATAGLIQTLLDQGKTVCLPKCLRPHRGGPGVAHDPTHRLNQPNPRSPLPAPL